MNAFLQIERQTAGFIPAGNNVIFDSSLYSEGDILYTAATGEIALSQVGTFIVQWFVAVQSSIEAASSVFAVSVAGEGRAIIGNSPLKTGATAGYAIVRVDAAPVTIALVNQSGKDVWYSTVTPVKSSLIVFRGTGLEHLVDGSTAGSLAGIGTYFDYVMGEYAVALGYLSRASGLASHAEGYNTAAAGIGAHAEGANTSAPTDGAHAEGIGGVASGQSSHAEGDNTTATDLGSHSEGRYTTAAGLASHAQNGYTQSSSQYSHAEGISTTSSGPASHAEGVQTTTAGFQGAHIMGTYGDAEMNFSWFLANGSGSARGLAAKILTTGEAYIDQNWNGGGADYAEMFESADGAEIEPGYFVALDDGEHEKIKVFNASVDDYVLGVTSAAPGFLGNAGELRWEGKYLTDQWGRIQYQETEIPDLIHESTGTVILPAHTQTRPVLNPEFDPETPYLPRSRRPEWVPVGLLGKLRVRDDGTCAPGGYCRPNETGVATSSADGYRVLKRTGTGQVMILFR
ncbi:hypothetical protein HSX37_09750|uniref:Peptidase_G2, IMC autoproteolytic cleavage domain n=1 Tax=Dendrosporobacter quercicolus TaxID=146817 RepID=A0A1G9QNR0_9FIRM|nr:peptidase G2 autoproteolytic cleavage domain-containing protein [Dendrosporobacter quercicolus]NSL48312.1 hypothetical protein [Dendrosporobacter quercicolus DSM 1736]SDM12654.1 Peptidase_G2, IMC autoproteolytic cleavage domain [Dendrosporobacter quercicolus]